MLSTQQSFLAKSEDQGGGGKSAILPFDFRDDENHSIKSDIGKKDKDKVTKDGNKKRKKKRK